MKLISLLILSILFLNTASMGYSINFESMSIEDLDPLTDVSITVEILTIRALEDFSGPDFLVKLYVNDVEYVSEVWQDTSYVYEPDFSITADVPDEEEFVNIKIQLWESDENILCDIGDETKDASITYSIKTGKWVGDDELQDPSGYGRLNGCDDGSVYEDEYDCELWFDIYQNDFDGDSLTYWSEVNTYGTDPAVDNTGLDIDQDEIPIEWENKWGYNPLVWEDHKTLDFDDDSITNFEEFIMSEKGADPFRQDLFLEVDFMEDGPNGEISVIPEETKDYMKNPFHRRNIVFHIDTGETYGGDLIDFDERVDMGELREFCLDYFVQNEDVEWKRSVYHYGIIAFKSFPAGFGFSYDVEPYWGYLPGTNCFVVSSELITGLKKKLSWYDPKDLDYLYASAMVHEMGHNLGIRAGNPKGCDVQLSKYPWQIGWWIYYNYKSIMNYHYTYKILDYSDGSHGVRDYDDWSAINLSYFEIPK